MKTIKLICIFLITAWVSTTQATIIGIDYSGTFDLTGYGASPTSTIDASLFWDTNDVGVATASNSQKFLLTSASFLVNGTDYSSHIDISSSYLDNTSTFVDTIGFVLIFSPGIDIDNGSFADAGIFNLKFNLPANSFDHLLVPQDQSFINDADSTISFIRDVSFGTVSTASASTAAPASSPIPEPGTILLLAFAIVVLSFFRQEKKSHLSDRTCTT